MAGAMTQPPGTQRSSPREAHGGQREGSHSLWAEALWAPAGL